MKVMIVDDERIIREGIAKAVDWQALGLTLVGVAADGAEGMALFNEYLPEIVITDIKMPEIDGLELIARIRTGYPDTVFIVLSAYAEFRIAQQAMRHGVKNYLLKPLNVAKIETALKEASADFFSNLSVNHTQRLSELESNPEWTPLRTEHPTLQRVIGYVVDRYADPQLSLRLVAEDVAHLNPDYLSRLFKEETGCAFSLFLNRVRIGRAQHALENNPTLGSKDLAALSGFGANVSYFGAVFRKLTGMTVTESRRAGIK